MPFSPKTWQDSPTTTTPISAAALIDLETRLSGYTDSSGGGITLAALAAVQPYAVDLPENHGAVRNGKTINDAAITTATNTLTSASAPFVAGDVGKTIMVLGAAAAGAMLNTTISGYTNATTISLTANAGTTVTGQYAGWGTDDTAAINSAITTVVTAGQANGTHYGEIWLTAGIYQIATSPTPNVSQSYGTTSMGNAQIQLPNLARTVPKFTLVIRGVPDASTVWSTGFPMTTRATLRSNMATNPNTFATYGTAAVIGGPTSQQLGTATSSNLNLVLDGVTIVNPWNNAVAAIDLQSVSEVHIGTVNLNASVNPATQSATAPSNGGIGLRMPTYFNEDNAEIDRLAIIGHGYGLIPGEHCNCKSAVIFYCKYAVAPQGPTNHAIRFGYLSTEGSTFHISSTLTAGGTTIRLHADCWDVEDVTIATTYHLDDSVNRIYGEADFHRYSTSIPHWGGVPLVNGGANFTIRNGSTPSGSAANLSIATLSSTLSTGSATTSLAVQALQSAIPAGTITLVSGANNQAFVTTGAAILATAIPVTSQTPNFAYPAATIITVTIPTSTTAFTNPYWNDAAVTITSGTVTVIAVDGQTTGLTSGTVIVPSGKTIAITYSVAPTWTWTLL